MAQLCMHFTDNTQHLVPDSHIDWVRMWDNGTYWSNIHLGVDRYDFAKLDAIVARNAGKSIVYCFGGTPNWLSTLQNVANTHHPWMGTGSHGLPRETGGTDPYGVSYTNGLNEWNKFCYVIAERYKGRIQAYEMWNEPQLLGYMSPWDNDTRQLLAKMCKRGAGTIKGIDPSVVTLAPNIFVGNDGRANRATKICEAMNSSQGKNFGSWANIDAMACHIYPDNGQKGAEWIRQLDQNKAIFKNNGFPSNKIWITETNYNLLGTTLPETQATYDLVMDTYNRAGGKFIFWYAWDRTADLKGLNINNNTMAYSAMVNACGDTNYPPISITAANSNSGWSGYGPDDSLTITYSVKNTSAIDAVTVTHNSDISPASQEIGVGETKTFTYTTKSDIAAKAVTFTARSGNKTSTASTTANVPQKPMPPALTFDVTEVLHEWEGSAPEDRFHIEYRVTNRSDATLTFTHDTDVEPATQDIAPSNTSYFGKFITEKTFESLTTTFTGKAGDGRTAQRGLTINVPDKPEPIPDPISIEVTNSNSGWEGYEEDDSNTITYKVTNTSDSDSLEITHNSDVSPESATIAVGENAEFTFTTTENLPSTSKSVTFVGTAEDGRIVKNTNTAVIDLKPTPPPPADLLLEVSGSFGEWTGDGADDYITLTFEVSNGSDSDALTVTHDSDLEPEEAVVEVGETEIFTYKLYYDLPENSFSVVFTGTAEDGRSKQVNVEVENIPQKPEPVEELPISMTAKGIEDSWTGWEEDDSFDIKFSVTNTSEADALTVSHGTSLTPVSAILRPGQTALFIETITENDEEYYKEVEFTGLDGERDVHVTASVRVLKKPEEPIIIEEPHELVCYFRNDDGNKIEVDGEFVSGNAELLCSNLFNETYPDYEESEWELYKATWDGEPIVDIGDNTDRPDPSNKGLTYGHLAGSLIAPKI